MIKGFCVSCKINESMQARAVEHCRMLAGRYGLHTIEFFQNDFSIVLISTTTECSSFIEGETIEFSLGQIAQHPTQWDRFLKIKINSVGLHVENDYAGSIPVFYSPRSGLILSNIEPCVFLGTGSSLKDLCPESLYGFLRYSHFIWDETAWVHIKQMLPDSRYIFSTNGELVSIKYLETIKSTDTRSSLSDKKVAEELFELNNTLVSRSLKDADEIVLPLSSGYDSRMIFSVLANDKKLADKTRCFTYGSVGSIEVEAARRLSQLKHIDWHHVDLPCNFLSKRYLTEISDIFGASLHMHGMYQIEFYEQIKAKYGISPKSRLTSGFMTGVPAGQHNGLLQITDSNCCLTDAMNRFSQSMVWLDADLEKMPIFAGKYYLEKAEERFRLAFDRFDGEVFQKAVMFDVWTRQRNFISYYPRVFEWLCPISSPHMCAEYANFFMSISKCHLWNRKAVELMFLQHYPDISKVASNSNGLASMGSQLETGLFKLSRIFSRLGIPNPLPSRYHNAPIEFDLKAVNNCKEVSFYPLLGEISETRQFIEQFGGMQMLNDLYQRSLSGDSLAYAQVVTLQAVALNGLLETSNYGYVNR